MLVPAAHEARVRDEPPAGVGVVTTRLRPHGVAMGVGMGLAARRFRPDVCVSHNYAALGARGVVFVHDVMFVPHPEWFTRAERAYFAPMVPLARRAGAVVTSTRTEAARIAAATGGPAPTAIGLGLGRALVGADPVRPAGLPASVDRFLLSVGRLNVRKNLSLTVEGALASGRVGPTCPLVVVGEESGRVAALSPAAATALDDGSILMLGGVPDTEPALALRAHRAVRVPLARRGVRHPAARGAALRRPGAGRRHRRPARDARRRRALRRPARRPLDRGRRPGGARRAAHRGPGRPRLLVGRHRRRAARGGRAGGRPSAPGYRTGTPVEAARGRWVTVSAFRPRLLTRSLPSTACTT
nr:hypothetical protein [Angustibacter aerolatus]